MTQLSNWKLSASRWSLRPTWWVCWLIYLWYHPSLGLMTTFQFWTFSAPGLWGGKWRIYGWTWWVVTSLIALLSPILVVLSHMYQTHFLRGYTYQTPHNELQKKNTAHSHFSPSDFQSSICSQDHDIFCSDTLPIVKHVLVSSFHGRSHNRTWVYICFF
jgi:hypothetical protein